MFYQFHKSSKMSVLENGERMSTVIFNLLGTVVWWDVTKPDDVFENHERALDLKTFHSQGRRYWQPSRGSDNPCSALVNGNAMKLRECSD